MKLFNGHQTKLIEVGIALSLLLLVFFRWITTPIKAEEEFVPSGAFQGEFFNNLDFTNLVLTRVDNEINFNWGKESPDPAIDAETFSVRWRGIFFFEQGRYEFNTRSDDGVRIYVDNELILSNWKNQLPSNATSKRNIEEGPHHIKVEYYEDYGHSIINVSWSKIGPYEEPVGYVATPTPTSKSISTSTPTQQPAAENDNNSEEAPKVLATNNVEKLPKTGMSDSLVAWLVGTIFLGLFGLYLYKRFNLVKI